LLYRKYAQEKATSTSDVAKTFPPTLVAKLYRNMLAYDNHFRAALWLVANNMATYDSGVVAKYEHTPCVTK
jgi:hypothetical protein